MLRRFNAPSFPKRMSRSKMAAGSPREPYKKMQGLRIRRIMMLSLMITVGLGIYYYLFRTGGSLNSTDVWSHSLLRQSTTSSSSAPPG